MNNQLEQVRTPEIIAQEIRGYTVMMLNSIIEIGRRMCEVKAMLPHGSFGNWIKENTGYSVSTANNFMRLFNEYADDQITLFGAVSNSQTLGNLSYTKALELLALPAEEREAFVETHDVENMSTRELHEAIKERDAAIERAKKLEQDKLNLTEQVEKLSENLTEAERDLNEVEKELEAARDALDKPIEAAVTATDTAEVEKAVAAALAAAAKEHAAEMNKKVEELATAVTEKEKLEKKLEAAKKAASAAESKAASGSEVYKAEAERAKAEAERLRREVAMADPVTAEFKGLFEQASVIAAKLIRLASEAPEASAPNLRAALDALGKQISEGVQ